MIRYLFAFFWAPLVAAAPPCEWRGIAFEEMAATDRDASPEGTLWREAAHAAAEGDQSLVFDRDSFRGMALFRQTGEPGSLAAPLDGGAWVRELRDVYRRRVLAPGKTRSVVRSGITWIVDASTGEPRYGKKGAQLLLPLAHPTSVVDHAFRTPLVDAVWLSLAGNRVVGVRPLFAENVTAANDHGAGARARLMESIARHRGRADAIAIQLARTKSWLSYFESPRARRNVERAGNIALPTILFADAGLVASLPFGYQTVIAGTLGIMVGVGAMVPIGHFVDPAVQAPKLRARLLAQENDLAHSRRLVDFLEMQLGIKPPPPNVRAAFARPIGEKAAAAPDFRPHSPELIAYYREHGAEMTSFERDRILSLLRRGERTLRTPQERARLVEALVVEPLPPGQPSEFARAYAAGDEYLARLEAARGQTFTPLPFAALFAR